MVTVTPALPASVFGQAAWLGILAYRRWVSPYKGFACPHRLLYGRDSCSAHGLRLLGRRPAGVAFLLMRRRLARCRAAATELAARDPVHAVEFRPDFAGGLNQHRGDLRRVGWCAHLGHRARDWHCWASCPTLCVPEGCIPDCSP